MSLDKYDEAYYGYAAAFLAAVCFGSFGVPVKSEIVSQLDIDPLVMQSYKSLMGFFTCWLYVLPMGYPIHFTPWGIVSGLFWVPGGVAGIYGIRTAGLAVAVGTWSSLIVLTSFAWGVFVFKEHVKSKLGACCACATLILGLMGMSLFSRPLTKVKDTEGGDETNNTDEDDDVVSNIRKKIMNNKRVQDSSKTKAVAASSAAADEEQPMSELKQGISKRVKVQQSSSSGLQKPQSKSSILSFEMERLIDSSTSCDSKDWTITIFRQEVALTKRQEGLLACIFNGLWGGTSMIPLHFAALDGYGGPSYVVSYCCGSMLVTVAIWILRLLFELYRHDFSLFEAYSALPSFHIRQMWVVGGLSGTLWSIGNFFSIIAVTHLGQGVGYSFTQASILVSGLWGIFRFKEIEGRGRIIKWLSSACIALTGIMWLSYEHAS
jgi:glucose uptake protein GlcU